MRLGTVIAIQPTGSMRNAICALGCLLSLQRHQDAGGTKAEMRCERIVAPGRVRCEVEARVGAGETIASGDVVIVRTPPFLSALRGRIGPHDATTRDPDLWRWALALAALGKGNGDVEARVRLVVCSEARCVPREASIAGHVVVGE